MGEIIRQVAGFYDGLLASLSKGAFPTTSMAVVAFLFALAAIAGIGKVWLDWLKTADRSQSMPALMLDFAQKAGGLFLVWLFVGLTPIMFSSISGSVLGTLRGLNAQVAAPAATLLDTGEQAISMVWNSQLAIQQNLANSNPWLFDGLQSNVSQANDAAQVTATMEKMKIEAMKQVAASKAEAAKLMASADPATQARGKALKVAASQQARQIELATTSAQIEQAQTQAEVARSSDGLGAGGAAVNAVIGGLTLGMSELFLLLKRVLAGVVGFVIIAIPLVLALMMCWKLLQSVISLFSHLAIYAAIVGLASAFSAALGPLMVVTFATQEWKRYGQVFVSFWLQALAGTAVLAVAVKLVATGIGSLAGMCATAGFAVYSRVTATTGIGEAIIAGATAGLAFMACSFAVDFFVSFVQKAPQAGIGVVSGSFHP
jgi:hypothetical protein